MSESQMVHGNGCPIVRHALTDLKALRGTYRDRGIAFFLINSNLQDDRKSINEEAEAYQIDFPILIDEAQIIGESLNLIRTGEVLVIDPDGWEIKYRGPINDRLTYERQKKKAKEQYLDEALSAVISREKVDTPYRNSIGCSINFPNKDSRGSKSISYGETVAPILKAKCVYCHRRGGIGPWAMSNYNMIRGFAPMIREVLRTSRMPPWYADPSIGKFKNNKSLTKEELQTLVHWIEAGAPRGDGLDPLDKSGPKSESPIEKPDQILDVPPFKVPATGIIDYQFDNIENTSSTGRWLRGIRIIPSDPEVLHHAGMNWTAEANAENHSLIALGGYTAGDLKSAYPKDTGVFIPPGGFFNIERHYTAKGTPSTDMPRLELYYYDEPPLYILRNILILDFDITIPPHAKKHVEDSYYQFDKDALLYSLYPHAHYRGHSASFILRYPDGRDETILSVPKWDFNWQSFYEFAQPILAPAGSKLIYRGVFDNSAQNFVNPDPDRTVRWGLQSENEMLFGMVLFRWQDETVRALTHNAQLHKLRAIFCRWDNNIDEFLERKELPERIKKKTDENLWKDTDRNGDHKIDFKEFVVLMNSII